MKNRLEVNLVPRSPTAKGKGGKQSEIWVRDQLEVGKADSDVFKKD